MSNRIVLSLLDYTGNMVQPWLAAGYECWIVDMKHRAGVHRDGRLVRVGTMLHRFLPPRREYAACFAFPSCDDIANSGNAHKRSKGLLAFVDGAELFARCLQIAEWTDAPYVVENPVGSLSGIAPYLSKPDHVFDPCDFGGYLDPPGDFYTKKTCLWTGGGFVMPEKRRVEARRVCKQGSWIQQLGGRSQETKVKRSATPLGFAEAVFQTNQSNMQGAAA